MARWWARTKTVIAAGVIPADVLLAEPGGDVSVFEVPAHRERLVRSWGFRRGEPAAKPKALLPAPTFEILKGSVRELRAELAAGTYDGGLESLRKTEELGKDRSSALDAIDDRIATLVGRFDHEVK